MLIDTSYFTAGPRHIQNCTLGKGTTMEMVTLMQYIEECQEEFLNAALGNNVATMVRTYLDELEADPDIEKDNKIERVCAKLRKPFADYVFFHVLRDSADQATITGLVRLKSANEYVSPLNRQVTTWNRMANSLNVFAEWVDAGECPIDGVVIDNNLLTPINRFNI